MQIVEVLLYFIVCRERERDKERETLGETLETLPWMMMVSLNVNTNFFFFVLSVVSCDVVVTGILWVGNEKALLH